MPIPIIHALSGEMHPLSGESVPALTRIRACLRSYGSFSHRISGASLKQIAALFDAHAYARNAWDDVSRFRSLRSVAETGAAGVLPGHNAEDARWAAQQILCAPQLPPGTAGEVWVTILDTMQNRRFERFPLDCPTPLWETMLAAMSTARDNEVLRQSTLSGPLCPHPPVSCGAGGSGAAGSYGYGGGGGSGNMGLPPGMGNATLGTITVGGTDTGIHLLTSIVPCPETAVRPVCPACNNPWLAGRPVYRATRSASGGRVRLGAVCLTCLVALRTSAGGPTVQFAPATVWECADCQDSIHGESAPVTSEDTAGSARPLPPGARVCLHCFTATQGTLNDGTRLYRRLVRDGRRVTEWLASTGACLCCSSRSLLNEGLCSQCDIPSPFSYGFKPTPRMLGSDADGRRLGIELEMSMAQSEYHVLRRHRQILEHAFYPKLDASVDSVYTWSDSADTTTEEPREPVEMVSHPMTLPEWRAYMTRTFRPWLAAQRRAGSRSWSTGSCGLHVHVDRLGTAAVARLRSLLRADVDWSWRVSGRVSRQHLTRYATLAPSRDRNAAINTENPHTTEFRLWAGTLNHAGILGTIELTAALSEWAEGSTVDPGDAAGDLKHNFDAWFAHHSPHYMAAAVLIEQKAGYLARATE